MKTNLKIDIVLNHIRTGKKPIILVKQLNISKQLLSYYLSSLRSKGIIKKVTNGVWELVKELPKDTSKVIRGHAFIWKVKLPKKIDWINKIRDMEYTYAGNTIRIILKGKKVWLCNKSIIIYEPKSFIESTPISARIHAVYELQEVIKELERELNINLGNYQFSVKREHFALIKNDLAKQVNLQGEKIYVYDNGEMWFNIDKSFNGDDAEFYKTKSYSGLVNSTGAQGYFNSQKNTGWKVTPEFVLNAFAVTQAQLTEYNKQIKSHLSLIQEYRKENVRWRKSESKKIKTDVKEGTQIKLDKYFK